MIKRDGMRSIKAEEIKVNEQAAKSSSGAERERSEQRTNEANTKHNTLPDPSIWDEWDGRRFSFCYRLLWNESC